MKPDAKWGKPGDDLQWHLYRKQDWMGPAIKTACGLLSTIIYFQPDGQGQNDAPHCVECMALEE